MSGKLVWRLGLVRALRRSAPGCLHNRASRNEMWRIRCGGFGAGPRLHASHGAYSASAAQSKPRTAVFDKCAHLGQRLGEQ
eukprot:3023572-Pyramimonas_sp.AAC.2